MSIKKESNKNLLPNKGKQECFKVLSQQAITALNQLKKKSLSVYEETIASLAQTCAALVILHHASVQSIISSMKKNMFDAHRIEQKQIDKQIKQLFKKRKDVSSHTFYGEHSVEDLTIKITVLENSKTIEIEPLIKKITHDALVQACRNNGIDIPASFTSSSYEYGSGK